MELRCKNKECNSSSIEEKDGKYICLTCGKEYKFAEVSEITSQNINSFVKILMALIIVGFIISLSFNIKTNDLLNNYKNAISLKNSSKYQEAKLVFAKLGDFLDSQNQLKECDKIITDNANYNKALDLMKSEKYLDAKSIFEKLDSFKDSNNKLVECNNNIKYKQALELMGSCNYSEAKDIFGSLGDFNNCKSILEHFEENIYKEAVENKKKGLFDEAIAKFKYLKSYNDSLEQIKICSEINEIKNTKVGGIVKFGNYEQDADANNGKEAIEWIVLVKKNNKAFLLSRNALENKKYNDSEKNVNWESSLIRKWLNNYFLNNAFNNMEQNNIFKNTISPDENPKYKSLDQGKETLDKVCLLSIKEFNDYLNNKELDFARKCEPTNFVKNKKYNGYYDSTVWRLRTLAQGVSVHFFDADEYYYRNAMIKDGTIDYYGCLISSDNLIRPAIWVNLDFE